MKTNLGKVAITPKGAWNSTTVYTALDTVNFGGGSWLAKRGNIAVTPTEGDDWMQLSAKGADAELTKDGIVSALGYTPERDYGNYELIESITLTEDTAGIIRTQEPDGTAYNFAKMAVTFRTPFISSGYVTCNFSDINEAKDMGAYLRLNGSSASGRTAYSKAEIAQESGFWHVRSIEYLSGYSTPNRTWLANILENVQSYYSYAWPVSEYPKIDTVKITGNKWSMPSGTIITIYGVRMN